MCRDIKRLLHAGCGAALLLCLFQSPVPASELHAGVARSCITPALGTSTSGGVGPGVAEHIHDDLFVRALVLDDQP